MSVFRVIKNRNYTVMSNYHLQDKNLSFKAKGMLSYMLSLSETWDYSINGLVKVSKEQIKAIRSIIKELEVTGYLTRIKTKNGKGLFEYNYNIYEHPCNQKGHTDNLSVDLDTQINTNKIITNKKDKLDKQDLNFICIELVKKGFISESDLDIYNYNDLFNELLNKYDYKTIMTATNYIIKRFNLNNGLDENGNKIINQFSYFKTSLLLNIEKLTNEVNLNWDK